MRRPDFPDQINCPSPITDSNLAMVVIAILLLEAVPHRSRVAARPEKVGAQVVPISHHPPPALANIPGDRGSDQHAGARDVQLLLLR